MAQLQHTTYASTSNALTHTITLSQPATAGSVMVIITASNAMTSLGIGWTLCTENISNLHCAAFTRVMAGNETTITVTLSAIADLYANIYEFNDVEATTSFSIGGVDPWTYGANLGSGNHTPVVNSRIFALYTNTIPTVNQVVTWSEAGYASSQYTAETQNTQHPLYATSAHQLQELGIQSNAQILFAEPIAGVTRGIGFALPLTALPPPTVSTRFWLNNEGDWVPVATTQL